MEALINQCFESFNASSTNTQSSAGREKVNKNGGMEACLPTDPVTSSFLLMTLSGVLDPSHPPFYFLRNSEDLFMLRV